MASPVIALRITSDADAAAAGVLAAAGSLDKLDASAKSASGSVDNASAAVKTYSGNAADAASKSAGVAKGVESVGDTAGRATTGLRDMSDAIAMAGFPELAAGMSVAATGLEAIDGAANLYRATSEALSGTVGRLTGANRAATASTNAATAATNRGKVATIGHKIALVAGTVATKVMTIAQRALNMVMRLNPIGLVVTAIMLLIGGLILAYNKSETFRKIVDKLWSLLKTSLVSAFNAVSSAVSTVVGWFQSAWNWVSKLIDKISNLSLPDWLPGVGGNITIGPTVSVAGTAAAGPTTRAVAPVTVIFNGPVGDPHAVARELRRVLRDDQSRLGRRDRPA